MGVVRRGARPGGDPWEMAIKRALGKPAFPAYSQTMPSLSWSRYQSYSGSEPLV